MLAEHGVQIAPSTFYAHAARGFGPTPAELEEAYAANTLHRLWVANRRLYGRRKLHKTARRQGLDLGRDQVERLMRISGIRGVRRGSGHTTTTSRPGAPRHPDRIGRDWQAATCPDQWWVADFSYVSTTRGFCYVSFITDVYSRRILGWRVSTSKTTPLVLSALEQALATRRRADTTFTTDGLLHHSDAGSQGGFNRSSQHLDCGGVWWDDRRRSCRRRRWGLDGSGPRIGRCALRCVHRDGRCRRGMCSGASGG